MLAVSTSTRQTQPAQGCLFWLGATRGWHYIKPCGAWQVLAGGNRDADSATRGWAPPEWLQAPDSLAHPGGQQHMRPPCTDASAQGMLAWGLSAVYIPPSHLPCAQGCTLRASTALSAQSLVHILRVCPWGGWLQTGHTETLSSSSQSQLPSTPRLCSALWVLPPGGVSGRLLLMGPQTLLCWGSCRMGFSGPRSLSQPLADIGF